MESTQEIPGWLTHKTPAFNFYTNDWLASNTVELMSLEEEGAYIRLLARCWSDTNLSLPNDDQELAKLSRAGKRWGKIKQKIKNCFIRHPFFENFLSHERLIEERKKAFSNHIRKSESGQAGAKKRWKTIESKNDNDCRQGQDKPVISTGDAMATPSFGNSNAMISPIANDSSSLSLSLSSSLKDLKDKTLVHPPKNAAEPDVEKVAKDPQKKITPKKFPESFEKIWKLYPHPVGKKNAFRHFSTSVDPNDTSQIETALQRYKNYVEAVRANGRNLEWQNGSTWFNQWQDWLAIRDVPKSIARDQPMAQQILADMAKNPLTLREKLEAKMAAGVNSD